MALMLFGFLALYTWNARTGYLDSLAEESGLELTGYLLRPGAWAADTVRGIWNHYFALVDVAEENAYLRQELRQAEEYLATAREEQAELIRLRALFGVSAPEGWVRMGSRVLAGRFGPNAAIESILIDRGYASGAPPGAPVLTHKGLAGVPGFIPFGHGPTAHRYQLPSGGAYPDRQGSRRSLGKRAPRIAGTAVRASQRASDRRGNPRHLRHGRRTPQRHSRSRHCCSQPGKRRGVSIRASRAAHLSRRVGRGSCAHALAGTLRHPAPDPLPRSGRIAPPFR